MRHRLRQPDEAAVVELVGLVASAKTYADALGRVRPRVAPLFAALAQAAATEPGCAAVRDEVADLWTGLLLADWRCRRLRV